MSFAIDFEPTTEESSLVSFLRHALEREWSSDDARTHATDPIPGRRLWEQFRDWDGLADAGIGALCLAHEELGARLAPGHTFGANLAVMGLRRVDPERAAAALADTARITFAAATTACPQAEGDAWILEPEGAELVVFLEPHAVVVDRAPHTVQLSTIDLSRRLGALAPGTHCERLNAPEEAIKDLHNIGALAAAADALGACRRLVEATRQHAVDRHQFGRPIGSFQALAHRIVDIAATVQLARAALHRAVALAAAENPARHEAVHVAKASVGDAVRMVSANAVHVHGAMGYTWEHDLHLFVRRAYLSDRLFGSGTSHEQALARDLLIQPSTAVHV